MKKILTSLIFCLVGCTCIYSQQYDKLSATYIDEDHNDVYLASDEMLNENYDIETTTSLNIDYLARHQMYDIKVPVNLYNHYKIGSNCYKAGWVSFSIGSLVTLAGGIVYGCAYAGRYQYYASMGKVSYDLNIMNAGTALMSVGGSLIGISLPLLCFGDHIKRESNVIYDCYMRK